MKTAKEFGIYFNYTKEDWHDKFTEVMTAFAKYHVEQALKAASEKAELDLISDYKRCEISKTTILEAYDLNNII
jgi:hypothetical protein